MSTPQRDMPLFAKTYAFLKWLIPLTNHFPKAHRHTVTNRLVNAALDFLECLLEANNLRAHERLAQLTTADVRLNKVRHYWRLVADWRWISPGQYEHGGRMVMELGRLLGGWRKVTV